MTNYYWEYPTLNVVFSMDGKQNIVIQVPYIFVADNGTGVSARAEGAYSVAYDPATPFVPYEALTQEQVQAWTEANVDIEALKVQLDAQIAEQVNAPSGPLTPPWAA